MIATEIWTNPDDADFMRQELEAGRMVLTPRHGDRTERTQNLKGGYKEGSRVLLRVHLGGDSFELWQMQVVVTMTKLTVLSELTEAELRKMPPAQRSKQAIQKLFARTTKTQVPKDATMTVVGLRDPKSLERSSNGATNEVTRATKQ